MISLPDDSGSDVGGVPDEFGGLSEVPNQNVQRLQVGGLTCDHLEHCLLQLLAVGGNRGWKIIIIFKSMVRFKYFYIIYRSYNNIAWRLLASVKRF